MSQPIKLSQKIKWIAKKKQTQLSFDQWDNIINIEGLDYLIKYLDEIPGSKGGNSNVFRLLNPEDPENSEDQIIIKICNQPNEESSYKYKRRFQREILALRKAKKASKNHIIKYFHAGLLEISGLTFPFYTMEKGDWDLAKYLDEFDIETDQRILICLSILKGFKELHELEIYHRDIKHDNIFLINDECKIGDLGLIQFRTDDVKFTQLELGDRIGAFGWESPETMNKFLTEKKDYLSYDCEIDSKSDIFQLGKLFWYIFQGNLPIGQITINDFIVHDENIFNLIFSMLQHSKEVDRRIQSIPEVEVRLREIAMNYSII
ncbi:protein kinase [archaeon]|jgi:serine/threonine protein kinase|nr:protein kinase [archaeon]